MEEDGLAGRRLNVCGGGIVTAAPAVAERLGPQAAPGHGLAPRPIGAVASAPSAGVIADLRKNRMGKLRRVDM